MEGYITQYQEFMIVTFVSDMSDIELEQFTKLAISKAHKANQKDAILDFSKMGMMDSYTYRIAEELTNLFKLMGLNTIWIGLSPGVISGLMELDVQINPEIRVEMNLESGLKYLREMKK